MDLYLPALPFSPMPSTLPRLFVVVASTPRSEHPGAGARSELRHDLAAAWALFEGYRLNYRTAQL
jgi:hypothetical protein